MGTKDTNIAEGFAAKLRELRAASEMTQTQLGEKMNPVQTAQAIARYESGVRAPTLGLLYQLARALRCKPCDLLPDGAEVPKPRKGKK